MVRDYKCTKCNFSATRKSNFMVHLKRVHEKIKDFECGACSFSAYTKGQVNFHMKVKHLNFAKSFKCQMCDYCTDVRASLENHKKSSHREKDQVDLMCMECNRGFVLKSNLIFHVKHVHHKLRPFHCELCDGKSFSTNEVLSRGSV